MRIIPLHFKLKGNNCEVEEEEVAEAVEIALDHETPLFNSAPAASFRLFSILFCFLATSLLFFTLLQTFWGAALFSQRFFSRCFSSMVTSMPARSGCFLPSPHKFRVFLFFPNLKRNKQNQRNRFPVGDVFQDAGDVSSCSTTRDLFHSNHNNS